MLEKALQLFVRLMISRIGSSQQMRVPREYFESTSKSLSSFWAFVDTGCSSLGRRFIGSAMVLCGRWKGNVRYSISKDSCTYAPVNRALGPWHQQEQCVDELTD